MIFWFRLVPKGVMPLKLTYTPQQQSLTPDGASVQCLTLLLVSTCDVMEFVARQNARKGGLSETCTKMV